MFPYWFELALRPQWALIWMVFGVGLPWAYAVLPRRHWRSLPLVLLLSLALGPMAVTAWMFVLGTVGGASETAALTAPAIFVGTAAIAAVGAAAAWIKRRRTIAVPAERVPLALDERMLVILIAAACVLRWVAAVWFPFWQYDPIWVYGYEGKLYTLLGYIPQDIGYYPQFLPLQYAYAQIMSGVLDDHVARAVFPLYHWGSILAAYALGRLTVGRRAGVYLAAIWALYPHVGQWATTGDLEIPQAFAFTGAAAFFLRAWLNARAGDVAARPYAVIAGLFLGIALWTKPTAGAFILGVGTLVAVEAVRVRLDLRRLWPRFQVALWCGVASIPLGALWYVRNVLLGHRAIDFPHPFWLTQAQRSGAEFGWPLLAAGLVCAWLLWSPGLRRRPNRRVLLTAWLLIGAGALPSIVSPHRMGVIEWALFGGGGAVLIVHLLAILRDHATAQAQRMTHAVMWGLLLAVPYFAVWFMSYSYHYRLSFAIVPLMIAPVAVIAARWIPPQVSVRRIAPLIGIPLLLAALPGIAAPLQNNNGEWDYLWSGKYPDDWRKMDSTNYALWRTVQALKNDIRNRGLEHPVIFAPGLQRLPFFFPLDDVRIDQAPSDLDQLDGVDYYVYTQEARWLYEEFAQPEVNQVTGSMYRAELMRPIASYRDGAFFGQVYHVRGIDRRFRIPNNIDPAEVEITWPFGSLLGTRLSGDPVLGGLTPPRVRLFFLASGPAPLEYTLYIHLLDDEGNLVTTWDSFPAFGEYAWYSTRLWEPDEIVSHPATLTLPADVTLEPGTAYTLRIGWYDFFADSARVPGVLADGSETDGVDLPYVFRAVSNE